MFHSEKQRVIKLLNLSRSDNDSEALSAIRKANKMCGNWESFLGTAPISRKPKVPKRPPPTKTNWTPGVSEMVQQCLDRCCPIDLPYVKELTMKFQHQGGFTIKQRDALEKIYKNLNR